MKCLKYLTLMFCILFFGCSSLPGTVAETADGRKVEHIISGRGTPVVIFENGLGGTLDWWSKVLPSVATETTALAYNRPGYGRSESSPEPRDGMQIVEELRIQLKTQSLPPPYILVGHSLGGLYMQLYARKYPKEVAALILVDSTHPNQLKGAGDPSLWPTWLKLTFGLLSSETAKRELAAADQTGQFVLNLPVDPSIPVFVLSALQPLGASSPLADDTNKKRVDIANLYPKSKQIWVDSDHGIPLERPGDVIKAIKDALLVTRKPESN